jgi:hypothetical protein
MHMLADWLGFMIATNILFRISICATCRLRRNILAKLPNMSSASCSRTISLRINGYFISTKSWLAINLRLIDKYWKNNEITEEDWVSICHSLIVCLELKQYLFKLETDRRGSELISYECFLLDRSYLLKIVFPIVSALLLFMALLCIRKTKSLLQIHSPMARE